jgi:2-iminoacetate synthase
MGYVPSFCTACYRLGRTGGDFMSMAKPGLIKEFCLPNALMTFKEYLVDYASDVTKASGATTISDQIQDVANETRRKETADRLELIENGERDFYF